MKDIKEIIAENIASLRTEAGLTQLKLAERLNYSDKAVSKWERAEALPDIIVLKALADLFGVTVDYLITDRHGVPSGAVAEYKKIRKRKIAFFSTASAILVFLLASALFAIMYFFEIMREPWLVYLYALPVEFTLLLVLNSVFGRRGLNYIISLLLLWTALLSAYLTLLLFFGINLWLLFVIGAPISIILLFVPGVSFVKFRIKWRNVK